MGTLVCRVELDKNKGLILTVENRAGKITQTTVMDGESITLTSQGQDDASSIVQKPGSIAIKCKKFSLESESITCSSSQDTLLKSKGKFDVQSGKAATLKSGAQMKAKADGDISVAGKKISADALGDAEISGTNAALKGKSKTEVKGTTLDLSGTLKAEVKAVSVDIAASGMLKAKGALTTIEGQMTTVKGTLTKVG